MKSRTKYSLTLLFTISLFLIGVHNYAQDATPIDTNQNNAELSNELKKTTAKLSFKLENLDIQINKGDLAANLLQVQNNTSEQVVFTVDMNLPDKWKSFGLQRYFSIEPGGQMFVPLRVLPMALEGNTRFFIGVNLREESGEPIGSEYFYISSFKVVDWSVSVVPGNKMYFKNGENSKDFEVSVLNKGNYSQDLMMRVKGQRENLIIQDEKKVTLESPKYSYTLDPLQDTTFKYTIEATNERRNFKSISIQDHKPNRDDAEKSYSLYVNTSEAKASGKGLQKMGTKIDFVKLANEKRVNQFAGPVLPLIVEANIQNLLGNNPFMNVMFRGFQRFDNGSNLIYFGQVNYTSNFYSQRYIENSAWYAGYFNRNYSAEIGNISGGVIGLPGAGKGVKANYRVYKNHWVGAFYLRNPTLFNQVNRETVGAVYKYEGEGRLRASAGIARATDNLRNRIANTINGRVSYRLAKTQNLSVLGAYSTRTSLDTNQAIQLRQGFMIGANYSARFLQGKLNTNVAGRYQNATFGLTDNERQILNARAQYRLNKSSALILNSSINQNTYPRSSIGNQFLTTNFFFYNMLAYNRNTKRGNIQPYTYAQSSEVLLRRINSFGLGTRYSNYIFNKNILWASNIFGGYNKAYFIPDLPIYFNFAANTILRIRTFTGMIGYFYGATSGPALISAINTGVTPEYIRVSANHQYLFKNRHFVIQNSAAYNYQNQARNSRVNYTPEIFYFTNSGWRFSANCNLSFGFRKSRAGFSAIGTPTTSEEEQISTNSNVRIGASIRKEFGIRIPFTEKKNFTKTFIAFYDQNGNSIKDPEEPTLENVVIQVGLHEVITNKDGVATLVYANGGSFAYKVFSLVDLKDWFPNITDSLSIVSEGKEFVPFVKGVKLYGKIVIDREKLAINADDAIDLTNIKITASGSDNYYTLTDFNGDFEFYLPNGSYTVSIDETILGSKYKLTNNNILVYLSQGVEGVFITFYIIERKRKVTRKKFGNGGVQTFGDGQNNVSDSSDNDNRYKLEDFIPDGEQNFGRQNAVSNSLDSGQGLKNQEDDNTALNPDEIPERKLTPPSFKPPIEDLIDINNIDPNLVGYFIDIGSFEGSIPIKILNSLLNMGFSKGTDSDGKLRFKSDNFKSREEAEEFKNSAISKGFSQPEPLLLGDYNGNEISADKAKELYLKGIEQQKNK